VGEDFFNAALDAAPADSAARLLLGDHLHARGDARGGGYRRLGRAAKWPEDYDGEHPWTWWNEAGKAAFAAWPIDQHDLPPAIWQATAAVAPLVDRDGMGYVAFATRREADDAAAVAAGGEGRG